MATASVDQAAFCLYADDNADPDSCTQLASVNVTVSRGTGTANRVVARAGLQNDNAANFNEACYWEYRLNTSGAWTAVATNSSVFRATTSTAGDETACDTQLLGLSGTFIAGVLTEDGVPDSNIVISKNNHAEHALCGYIVDADVSDADLIDLRIACASGEIDTAGDLIANLGGVRIKATVVRHGDDLTILCGGAGHRLVLDDPAARAGLQEVKSGSLTAPMPGKVVAINVKPGDAVKRGATLMVLVAMKMEHAVIAPTDGTVAKVRYDVGEQVEEGAVLVSFEDEGG